MAVPSQGGTWPPSAVPEPNPPVLGDPPNPPPPKGVEVVVELAPKPGLFPPKRLFPVFPVLTPPKPPLVLFVPKPPKVEPPDGADEVAVLLLPKREPLLVPNPPGLFPPNRELLPVLLFVFAPKPPKHSTSADVFQEQQDRHEALYREALRSIKTLAKRFVDFESTSKIRRPKLDGPMERASKIKLRHDK